MIRRLFWLALALGVSFAAAQNPQTQTAPLFATNAKYTNGVAPGYMPCANAAANCPSTSGLNLSIGSGTANCAGTIATYTGGSLTMTASATNYVYLNTAASCVPAVKTTAFTSSDIPIATIVASGSSITSIVDDRTPFSVPSSGGSVGPGTTNKIPKFATSTTVGDSHCDDGATATGTVTCTEPISALASYQGFWLGSVGNATVPTPSTAAWVGWIAPISGSPNVFFQLPNTAPTVPSVMVHTAPSTVNSVSQSPSSLVPVAGSGAAIPTGPATSTANDCVKYADNAGTLSDTGSPCGSGGGGSGNYVNVGGSVTFTGCTYASGVCRVGSGGTSSITISSIPGTYLNLEIDLDGQTSASVQDDVGFQFNGDTASHYDRAYTYLGPSSPAGSSTAQNTLLLCTITPSSSTNRTGGCKSYFRQYAGTTFYKGVNSTGYVWWTSSGPGPSVYANSGDWQSTTAITSMTLTPVSGTFSVGTTLVIYGTN